MDAWIQTLDGKRFDILAPTSSMIDPRTIWTVLSRIPRFAGHSGKFYSVAQHSVIVMQYVAQCDASLWLPALLHDAHEGYSGFGDVCTPAKQLAPEILRVERGIDIAISARFGFPVELFYHEAIRYADLLALSTEKRDLMGVSPCAWPVDLPRPHAEVIRPLNSLQSLCLFRDNFNRITRKVLQC